jgi:hypothetical protein
MMQLISLFQKQGFTITFASPAQDSDFIWQFKFVGQERNNSFK